MANFLEIRTSAATKLWSREAMQLKTYKAHNGPRQLVAAGQEEKLDKQSRSLGVFPGKLVFCLEHSIMIFV